MNECSSNSTLFTQSREASTEFDCLLVAPSAHGLVRHCVALLELLRSHSINGALVSGPEAAEVLSDISTSIPFIASREHSIDWARSGGEGSGHVQQICRRNNLERIVRQEISLCERHKPRFLITKNFFSVPISAHSCRIPFVTYQCTVNWIYHRDASKVQRNSNCLI